MAQQQKLTVRMTPDLYARVSERAKARGISMNDWINQAIRYALSGKHAIEIRETITSQKVEL